MINKDELLFVVDENNNPVEPRPRSEVHEKGLWHRTAQVLVMNDKKEILCHKRSMLKDTKPGEWDAFFGGHLSPGAEYVEGAIQELKEETGIQVTEEELYFHMIYRSEHSHEFQAIYVVTWNGDIESLSLEENEVDEIAWVSVHEAMDFFEKNNSPLSSSFKPALLEKLKHMQFS